MAILQGAFGGSGAVLVVAPPSTFEEKKKIARCPLAHVVPCSAAIEAHRVFIASLQQLECKLIARAWAWTAALRIVIAATIVMTLALVIAPAILRVGAAFPFARVSAS